MIDIIKQELIKFYQEEHGNRITIYNIEGIITRLLNRIEVENVDKEDRLHNPGE